MGSDLITKSGGQRRRGWQASVSVSVRGCLRKEMSFKNNHRMTKEDNVNIVHWLCFEMSLKSCFHLYHLCNNCFVSFSSAFSMRVAVMLPLLYHLFQGGGGVTGAKSSDSMGVGQNNCITLMYALQFSSNLQPHSCKLWLHRPYVYVDLKNIGKNVPKMCL